MLRSVVALLVVAAVAAQTCPARPESPATSPPMVYEVQINGESFLVEGNRFTKLESKEKPGVRYDVAVRVAPTQRVRLSTVQFDYDLPAKVELGGRSERRSARLIHELGFSLLIRDLGGPLDSKGQKESLENLLKSVTAALRDAKVEGLDVAEPHDRKFEGSTARGITIRYRDARGFGHIDLLYVLAGPGFAATTVVEFLENDSDDVLPLVKRTLDSIGPIGGHR
jgi:hypothetical protein